MRLKLILDETFCCCGAQNVTTKGCFSLRALSASLRVARNNKHRMLNLEQIDKEYFLCT